MIVNINYCCDNTVVYHYSIMIVLSIIDSCVATAVYVIHSLQLNSSDIYFKFPVTSGLEC